MVTAVSRILTTSLAIALLLTPIILLNSMSSKALKTGVTILFSVFFSSVLSVFTHAPSHEIFSTTAAYDFPSLITSLFLMREIAIVLLW